METTDNERGIILIVGGGGMAGIFSAGVLKSLEAPAIKRHIRAVYAVSVGACTAARYLVDQSELGGKTFRTRFANNRFIKPAFPYFIKYFLEVIFRGRGSFGRTEGLLDFGYFRDVILDSEDRIDLDAVAASCIDFRVKVFNHSRAKHEFVSVRGVDAYAKIEASASMTPLIARCSVIGGEEYFDGDTIASDVEESMVRDHPGMLVIRISNCAPEFWPYNFFHLFVVGTLMWRLYGGRTAWRYFVGFFKKPFLERKISKYPNVVSVRPSQTISPFCKDTDKLADAYREWLEKGIDILRHIPTGSEESSAL